MTFLLRRKCHNIFLLKEVKLIKQSQFSPAGSGRYFAYFSHCFYTLWEVLNQVRDFFPRSGPCSLTQPQKLCILYCFLRRLLSRLTQTVVGPIRHHLKLITTTMIKTQKRLILLMGRIILINLILVERSAVHSPAHQWGPFVPACPCHLKPVNMISSQHLGDNKKQIVLSGFIKDHH